MLTQLIRYFLFIFSFENAIKNACLINASQKLTPVKLTLDRN